MTTTTIHLRVDAALKQILPGAETAREAMSGLGRSGDVSLLVVARPGTPLVAWTAAGSATGRRPHDLESHVAAVGGRGHAVRGGWDPAAALSLAERVAQHALDRPGAAVPPQMLQRPS